VQEQLDQIAGRLSRIENRLPISPASSKGRIDAVVGAQWGDEGKGKLVDILSGKYHYCARVAGGSNAGHTIVVNVSIIIMIMIMIIYDNIFITNLI